MKTKSFTSIKTVSATLTKIMGGLRTPLNDASFLEPNMDVVDLEIKITVSDALTHKTKEVMFDGVLSDETLLMVYKDVERELKNGDNTRSKSKKGSDKTS